jgi:enoyl-CoA hydratase
MGMAKKLVLTGEHISAQEAYRIGLVDVLVPPSELDDATAKLCRRIASKSPIALAMGKEAINRGMQADLRTALSIEARCFCLCFGSEDRQEGMNAFLEKRKPDFKGR